MDHQDNTPTHNDGAAKKKPYTAPCIEDSLNFETLALQCGTQETEFEGCIDPLGPAQS